MQGFVVHLLWHELIQLFDKRLGQHCFDGRGGRADLAGGLPLRADGIQLHKGVVSHLVDLVIAWIFSCMVTVSAPSLEYTGETLLRASFFQRIGSGGISTSRGAVMFSSGTLPTCKS